MSADAFTPPPGRAAIIEATSRAGQALEAWQQADTIGRQVKRSRELAAATAALLAELQAGDQ